MMPRTLLAFFGAVALLLVGLSQPAEKAAADRFLPLDLEGIEVIEVVSRRQANIILSTARAPGVRFMPEPDQGVEVRRVDERLVIESSLDSYRSIIIELPATTRHLIVHSADVAAETPVDAMVIEVGNHLKWEGGAARLEVRHAGTTPARRPASIDSDAAGAECDDACRGWVAIHSGKIAEVEITSASAHVGLNQLDDIGQATLHLGPGATFSLGGATGLDNLQLESLDAPAIVPSEPETPTP